jgi:hypothetical protein
MGRGWHHNTDGINPIQHGMTVFEAFAIAFFRNLLAGLAINVCNPNQIYIFHTAIDSRMNRTEVSSSYHSDFESLINCHRVDSPTGTPTTVGWPINKITPMQIDELTTLLNLVFWYCPKL